MTFSEILFYELVICYYFIGLFFIAFSEDIKDSKRFKKYLTLSTILLLLGILMEFLGWTYLCRHILILTSIVPLFALLSTKGLQMLFIKLFKKEPFQMYRGT